LFPVTQSIYKGEKEIIEDDIIVEQNASKEELTKPSIEVT
jgi:hypothetical protein